MHTIKTYNMNSKSADHSFYMLSKGYNAGKPLEKACPNCFLISTDSEVTRTKLFWICYSLWKSGTFIPLLSGSVIPFLHIDDVRKTIHQTMERIDWDRDDFRKTVHGLQQLIKTETLLEKQLQLVSELKIVAARKLLSRR